jgi:hypothetical protein
MTTCRHSLSNTVFVNDCTNESLFSEQVKVSLTQGNRAKVALSIHGPGRLAAEAEAFDHSLLLLLLLKAI